ncbi:unnamed protein product, partial [Ectocarpus sp. 12 AP-2014]
PRAHLPTPAAKGASRPASSSLPVDLPAASSSGREAMSAAAAAAATEARREGNAAVAVGGEGDAAATAAAAARGPGQQLPWRGTGANLSSGAPPAAAAVDAAAEVKTT